MGKIDENANYKLYENFQQMAKELAGVQEKSVEDIEKTEGEDEILTGENVTLEEGEQPQTREKGRVNQLHNPALNATDNFDLAEKICDKLHAANANMKNSFDSGDVKIYTGAAHAMLKAAGVNINATTKVFFNIFSLMQLMLETAQQQRTAGREMRQAELLATVTSIERQADKQVEAAAERRDAALMGAGFSIGMGAVSIAAAGFGTVQGVKGAGAEGEASRLSDMADEVLDASKEGGKQSVDEIVGNSSKAMKESFNEVLDGSKGNMGGNLTSATPEVKVQVEVPEGQTGTNANGVSNSGAKGSDPTLNAENTEPPKEPPKVSEPPKEQPKVEEQPKEQPKVSEPPKEPPKAEAPQNQEGLPDGQTDKTINVKLENKTDESSVGGGNGGGGEEEKMTLSDAEDTIKKWQDGGKGKPSPKEIKAAWMLRRASRTMTIEAKNHFTAQSTIRGVTEGLSAIGQGTGKILESIKTMEAEMIQAEATKEQVNQKFAEAAMQDATEAMQTAQEVINTVIRAMLQVLTSQVEMMKQLHFA